MRRLRTQPVLAALSVVTIGCSGGGPDVDATPADAGPADAAAQGHSVVTQPAAMILHYPHDDHKFGELPPDLTSVAGATATLERYADHVLGTIDTRLEPGHVGRLIAVVINNPAACEAPTPGTACGPHEEEFNAAADGGFYLGSGAVARPDGRIRLTVRAGVGDASNVLCRGAANPEFNACETGFSLRDPYGAEVTLVVLDNGPAAKQRNALTRQLAALSPCRDCPSFTAQVAIGFGRQPKPPARQ